MLIPLGQLSWTWIWADYNHCAKLRTSVEKYWISFIPFCSPFLRQDKCACCSGWFQTCNSLALAPKLLGWLQVHATAPKHIHQFLKNFNYTFKNLQKPVAAHQFCWRSPTWHCDSVVCAEASMTSLTALPHDSWVMRITDSAGITFNCHLKCLLKDYIVIWHNEIVAGGKSM